MDIKFFDVHAHINFEIFKNDYKNIIAQTFENKIGIITSGTYKYTSQSAVTIANEYLDQPIYATIGLHPIHCNPENYIDHNETSKTIEPEIKFDLNFYHNLALNRKVIGIGECGLDFYHIDINNKNFINNQKNNFQQQIKLSFTIKKPLIIHCRNAFIELIQILQENKNLLLNYPGIIHFFSGTKEQAKQLLNLGFSFSFGGVITFTNNYNELIKFIPIENILPETDAPYVAPVPYRGKRNQPNYVIETIKQITKIKNISIEDYSPILLNTVHKIFKI
ncbi:MAG: TatD family hydrolase [Minisyncoccia bacterium]